MNVVIEISPEERAAYEARAMAEGLSLEAWLKKLANERAHQACRVRSDITRKSLLELFAPLRGLDLDFSRNPSTGRALDL